MLDLTAIDRIGLDLDRLLELDTTARLRLRDGAGALLGTLSQSASGWYVEQVSYGDAAGSIRLQVAEGGTTDEGDEITYALLAAVDSVDYRQGGGAPDWTYVRPELTPPREASSRVWTVQVAPVGPAPADLTFPAGYTPTYTAGYTAGA